MDDRATWAASSLVEIKQPPAAPAAPAPEPIRYTLSERFAPYGTKVAAAMHHAQRLGISEVHMVAVLTGLDGKLSRLEGKTFIDEETRKTRQTRGWDEYVRKHGEEQATRRPSDGRTFWKETGLADVVDELGLADDFDIVDDGAQVWNARERPRDA